MCRKEVGAFVYQLDEDGLKLVLINNRKQTRWILPKGQIEENLSDKKVALKEVYEEAGIIGMLEKDLPVKVVRYMSRTGSVELHVYTVQIAYMLDQWPEKHFRQRVMVDVDVALLMVRKKALRVLITQLATEIEQGY